MRFCPVTFTGLTYAGSTRHESRPVCCVAHLFVLDRGSVRNRRYWENGAAIRRWLTIVYLSMRLSCEGAWSG